MNKDYKLIAKALRCSTMVGGKCHIENCPYKIREAVSDELAEMVKPDVEENGVAYWISCDYDAICMDASDAIERLTE